MDKNNTHNDKRPAQIAQLIDTHKQLQQKLGDKTNKLIQKNSEKTSQVVKSWLLEK